MASIFIWELLPRALMPWMVTSFIKVICGRELQVEILENKEEVLWTSTTVTHQLQGGTQVGQLTQKLTGTQAEKKGRKTVCTVVL